MLLVTGCITYVNVSDGDYAIYIPPTNIEEFTSNDLDKSPQRVDVVPIQVSLGYVVKLILKI